MINAVIDEDRDGVRVKGGINAAVAASVGEPDPSSTSAAARQRIVHRRGKTVVSETKTTTSDKEETAVIDARVAAPVNVAVALNCLGDDSEARATAEQSTDIDQEN